MNSLLNDLEQCLVGEQKALVAGAADDLDRLRAHKNVLLGELNTALISRQSSTRIERSLVEELARLNALNGALVAQQFARTKARADALLGAAEAALYSAGGTFPTPSSSGSSRAPAEA